jgi:CheY-like chemotaxis protein
MLGEMLSILGHKPRLCHSAPQAIELIESEQFDLILSDYRMPTMDGQEFYEHVCQKHPEMASRVAFLSGDVVSDETQAFLQASGRAHLAKPFRLDHVLQLVSRLLAEPVSEQGQLDSIDSPGGFVTVGSVGAKSNYAGVR